MGRNDEDGQKGRYVPVCFGREFATHPGGGSLSGGLVRSFTSKCDARWVICREK